MDKKYCFFSITIYFVIMVLFIVLVVVKVEPYITMPSIFIPILVGVIINYDKNKKEVYKLYYKPLYHYIKTYYDILSQSKERLKMGKKHEMMSNIARDMILFLNNNLKYASNELSDKLSIMLFYKYENINENNEYQDIYDINTIVPIIAQEMLNNYNVLHVDKYLKRKKLINKKYHIVNGLVYLYVDSFIMDIARKKEYIISLYQCADFYQKIADYRSNNYINYYKIYKYLKKYKNEDIDSVILDLKNKFQINIFD